MIPNCKRQTCVPGVITVQVDTRERYPVLFPANIRISDPSNPIKKLNIKVITENIKLDDGDYRLKEFPDCCVVERKGGQRELFKNFFDARDKLRCAKAFRRLSAARYPVLLLEVSPAALLSTRRAPFGLSPESLCDRLTTVIAKYGFHVMWTARTTSAASRRKLGRVLVHLMLSYALRELLEPPFAVAEPESKSESTEDSEAYELRSGEVVPVGESSQ